ncbi:MAG: hypoxanthine phosphoribosyltransferase [Armatimonadetes bacterium]|nr:hypoxanthine phosphoribosyltransferase [Armatimonadota bacterium]MBS1711740.1 hypoxanthine phosphoribosyltransferase [Armatimonadota bacterium]MBX3109706.1 hypoxanthine phosphoribosyltransferase [Fimbriimonadaceae bacterium]
MSFGENLETLIPADRIQARVAQIAQDIRRDIGDSPILLLCVLKGAFPFLADLAKNMEGDVLFDFIQVSSWAGGRESTGSVRIKKDHDFDIKGMHVVLVEDIVDSGLTLTYLRELLGTRQPASLRVAALLSKPDAREHNVPVEYIGFEIENRFVVGYGLDDGERFRNLPYVAAVIPTSEPV